MTARIYQPAKTAMQSGHAKTMTWVLEWEPEGRRTLDPLMGWTSSADMRQQVRLVFDTREEAEAYARADDISYVVAPPHARTLKPKSYAANFAWGRVR